MISGGGAINRWLHQPRCSDPRECVDERACTRSLPLESEKEAPRAQLSKVPTGSRGTRARLVTRASRRRAFKLRVHLQVCT